MKAKARKTKSGGGRPHGTAKKAFERLLSHPLLPDERTLLWSPEMEALANQGDPFKAIPTPPPEIRICDLLFAWTERVWVYGVPGSSYIPLAAFIMNWLMTHGGFRCTLPCKLYVTVKVTPTGNTSQVGFPFGFLSGQEVIIKVSVICATIV